MGFMDKLRAETIDIVEWIDDSRHTLVWRFPRYHNQIKNGARLIVRPGQLALFVHQGQLADVFEPGTHRLTTGNLPVLSTLAGWKHGFDSPFKAEVYFVSTRQIPDLKWGTPNPVMLRDADFGPVRVRAFGTYALRALDAKRLLEELVGTDGEFEAEEVTELLRSIVAEAFADVVASMDIPIVDLAGNYAALGEEVRKAVVERIDDEYGLEIPTLAVVNVSLPPEVEKAIDARAGMEAVGDVARYQAFQLGSALPQMAAGEAGGVAGAGMGAGVGMVLASRTLGMTGGPAPGSGAPQAPPPPPPASWHIVEAGQSVGPFSGAQLADAVQQGRVRAETLVWFAGMSGWMQAGQVPQLAGLFGPPPPPIPRS